jgi:predicted DNA-binding transcriptional regulator AlpA
MSVDIDELWKTKVMNADTEELWRVNVITKKLGVAETTWCRWASEGKAPKARIKRHRYSAWAKSDICAFMEGKTNWGAES